MFPQVAAEILPEVMQGTDVCDNELSVLYSQILHPKGNIYWKFSPILSWQLSALPDNFHAVQAQQHNLCLIFVLNSLCICKNPHIVGFFF